MTWCYDPHAISGEAFETYEMFDMASIWKGMARDVVTERKGSVENKKTP